MGKTQVESDRGIAITLNEWSDVVAALGPDVIVAVRRAIWERHTAMPPSGQYVLSMISGLAYKIALAHTVVSTDQQHTMT